MKRRLLDPSDLSTAVHLTFRQLARYVGYEGRRAPEAARKFAERHQLPKQWRGGAWLVKRADVDRVLRGERIAPALRLA